MAAAQRVLFILALAVPALGSEGDEASFLQVAAGDWHASLADRVKDRQMKLDAGAAAWNNWQAMMMAKWKETEPEKAELYETWQKDIDNQTFWACMPEDPVKKAVSAGRARQQKQQFELCQMEWKIKNKPEPPVKMPVEKLQRAIAQLEDHSQLPHNFAPKSQQFIEKGVGKVKLLPQAGAFPQAGVSSMNGAAQFLETGNIINPLNPQVPLYPPEQASFHGMGIQNWDNAVKGAMGIPILEGLGQPQPQQPQMMMAQQPQQPQMMMMQQPQQPQMMMQQPQQPQMMMMQQPQQPQMMQQPQPMMMMQQGNYPMPTDRASQIAMYKQAYMTSLMYPTKKEEKL